MRFDYPLSDASCSELVQRLSLTYRVSVLLLPAASVAVTVSFTVIRRPRASARLIDLRAA